MRTVPPSVRDCRNAGGLLDPAAIDLSPVRLSRRLRRRARLLAGAAAAAVLITIVVAAVPVVAPALRATTAPVPRTPDALLIVGSPEGARASVLLPGATVPRPPLDGGYAPAISPDGRVLLVTRSTRDGATWRASLTAFSTTSFAHLWRTEVSAQPVGADGRTVAPGVEVAMTRDRVYAVDHVFQSRDPATVTALDLRTGRETNRWTVDAGGHRVQGIGVLASPSGDSLSILAAINDPTDPQHTAIFRFHLPDGRLELARNPIMSADPMAPPLFFSGRIAPDGRTLYYLAYQAQGSLTNWQALSVDFFDTRAGALLPRLDIPFGGQEDLLPYEHAVSADGRTLYALAPTLRKLAVVDLAQRRLVRLETLDVGSVPAASRSPEPTGLLAMLGDLFVRRAEAKLYFQGQMQLAPDGRRLYAIGATGHGHDAKASGIWVIDVATGRVADDWLPGRQIATILLDGTGTRLFAQEQPSSAFSGTLDVLDSASGTTVSSGAGFEGSVTSLHELYQEQYGGQPSAAAELPWR